MKEKPNIYGYDDFRLYLRDCYEYKKSERGKYTFRQFATEAGFTNPGYINDVIKGRRRLSSSAVKKVIKAFDIPPKEQEFFELLVSYGQCKKEGEKEKLYQQILFRRSRSLFTRVNSSLVKYYQDFKYPLVRSALEVMDFRGDYEALAKFLQPGIPTGVLKKIVRDLCDWGMVSQKPNGSYAVTDKFVEPPATMAQLIRQLNKQWITQGRDALSLFGPDQRHISSMLLGISRETRDVLFNKIEAFRKEVFDLINEDDNPEVLMQLSLQYFPKSNVEVKS